MASKDKPITAYKAFDKNFQCRGYQYEVGKTYEHDGDIDICRAGFHSCENPFDVLNYYPITESRFAKVTASGAVERHDDDSKICSAKLAVEIELTLPEFIKSAVAWIIETTRHKSGSGNYAKIGSSGYSAQIGSSGHYAKIGSSGNYAKIDITGKDAVVATAGRATRVKAEFGTWVSVAEFDGDGKCVGFATGQVGHDEIPPDTWLVARGGKLVAEH